MADISVTKANIVESGSGRVRIVKPTLGGIARPGDERTGDQPTIRVDLPPDDEPMKLKIPLPGAGDRGPGGQEVDRCEHS